MYSIPGAGVVVLLLVVDEVEETVLLLVFEETVLLLVVGETVLLLVDEVEEVAALVLLSDKGLLVVLLVKGAVVGADVAELIVVVAATVPVLRPTDGDGLALVGAAVTETAVVGTTETVLVTVVGLVDISVVVATE